jgi:hypothetical protein
VIRSADVKNTPAGKTKQLILASATHYFMAIFYGEKQLEML